MRRKLTISAAGAESIKAQQVAVGVTAELAESADVWHEIVEIRLLSPVGMAVLFEVDLAA